MSLFCSETPRQCSVPLKVRCRAKLKCWCEGRGQLRDPQQQGGLRVPTQSQMTVTSPWLGRNGALGLAEDREAAGGVASARAARVGLECGYRGWHCAPGAGAVALAHRDDADCLGAAPPSASKGEGKVELQSPLGFPCSRAEGRRVVTKPGRRFLATSAPCSASAD